MVNQIEKFIRNNQEFQIGGGTISFSYNDEIIGYFKTAQVSNKTIVIPVASGGGDVTEQFVRSMIYAGVGDYDNMFRATSGLYKILNALDENDNLGLTEGEVWEDIVASQTSMSKISHSYSAMVCVASSKVAMDEILDSSVATNEMSECWNSISVIAESELGSQLYLESVNGITALFTYQTAQDAFFANPTKKQEIISQHIMTIVNNNTLLSNLYTDSVVANAIIDSQDALNAIASSSTKLGIVDDSSSIMSAIAINATALGNMSDSDFSTYILENSTYLTTTTGSTAGQNRINSMDADDLLPAIFYWTGLSGYSTFADLAASDTAMAIVQSDTESMLIISCNEEAQSYLARLPVAYKEVEYIENSSSGPRIDLGHMPTNQTMSQIKFRSLVSTGYVVIGFYAGNDNVDYRLFNLGTKICWDLKSSRIQGSTLSQNVDYEWELGNNYVKNLITSSTLVSGGAVSSYTATYNMTLNHSYVDGQNSCNRWYYVKIYENNVLIRDLVPCYRKSDSVVGMYDLVNDTFYTNSGTGSFTKGADV